MIDQARRLREITRSRPVQTDSRSGTPTTKPTRLRAVAVASGKGGVGKTNIALMLGIGLSSLKKRVLLFDADLGLANAHILLGIAPRRNLVHVADGECSIEDIVCKGPEGIGLVPGASGVESMANADSLRLGTLRRHLVRLEDQYDFVLIDTSAGIGSGTTEFAAGADMCLCVMTPEPTSLADAYAMVKVLHEKKTQRIAVLVNMASSDTEGQEAFGTLNRLTERFLGRKLGLMGILPADRDIPRLIRRQKIMLVENPRSVFSTRIMGCARKLCGLPAPAPGGFFARFLARIGQGSRLTAEGTKV